MSEIDILRQRLDNADHISVDAVLINIHANCYENKQTNQTKPNPDFTCSDLLHPHRDEVPSRPENPPVVPLLQPHLSLQGELIGDQWPEVVRRHEGPSPKIWNLDESLSTIIRYIVMIIRFVPIYALFGRLGANIMLN